MQASDMRNPIHIQQALKVSTAHMDVVASGTLNMGIILFSLMEVHYPKQSFFCRGSLLESLAGGRPRFFSPLGLAFFKSGVTDLDPVA